MAEQIIDCLFAIPAFLPATLCTGYLAAWITNLHGFQQRSIAERMFWSVPLSLAISPIASALIGKAFSLAAVVLFLQASAVLFLGILGMEWIRLQRSHKKWNFGWYPLGGTALILSIGWIVFTVLSLVDFQSYHALHMSQSMFDLGSRINWIDSILRTGVPPANSMYFYGKAASMHNYYFWYVICAAVAQMAHLPVRSVLIASCIWAGFSLASLTGLYLKYFLEVGSRLRSQFLLSMFLLMVSGLDICANFWNILYLNNTSSGILEYGSLDIIPSWPDALVMVPHHIAGLVCCMLAFLLAHMAEKDGEHSHTACVALIAVALASAFGLSIYVPFAFFLITIAWGFWQVAIEHRHRATILLAMGGAGAAIVLIPYLWDLTHTSAGMHAGNILWFSVREVIPPDGLLGLPILQHLSVGHFLAARNFANLILLAPGYVIQLGFYLAVLLIYLIPAWRGRTALTPARKSLVFIVVATIPFHSLVRSSATSFNDFGFRTAFFLQFPLLLLASELITSWNCADRRQNIDTNDSGLPCNTPHWLRSIASFALVIGVASTLCEVLALRIVLPLVDAKTSAGHDPAAPNFSHNAYISSIGYAKLDVSVPKDAIVQFNPNIRLRMWTTPDQIGINRQAVISYDKPWCGSELGGDPSGCLAMAAAIDSIFNGATAEQARTTCRLYGIQYLVVRIYDPAWKDKNGWVWALNPVVSDPEFRALECSR
jgi:hypothetical protein